MVVWVWGTGSEQFHTFMEIEFVTDYEMLFKVFRTKQHDGVPVTYF